MKTKKAALIHARVEPQTEAKLRSIAKRLGCKRSEAVRRLIDGTDVASPTKEKGSVPDSTVTHATFA